MPEGGAWLHVRVAGMDLLLATRDLREVVAPLPVSAIPGGARGIQGVVMHQGEFLPVLAWEDLPGCGAPAGPTTALAVLRPRLGLPIERVVGTLGELPEPWCAAAESEPASAWSGGSGMLGDRELRMVDADRLVALLRRLRADR